MPNNVVSILDEEDNNPEELEEANIEEDNNPEELLNISIEDQNYNIKEDMNTTIDLSMLSEIDKADNDEKNIVIKEAEYDRVGNNLNTLSSLEYNASLDKKDNSVFNSDLLDDGSLNVKSSVFINSMNLNEGITLVKCDPKKFNKAVRDVIAASLFNKIIKKDINKTLITTKFKTVEVLPILNYSKDDIIEYARGIRAKCFNILMGNNPNGSNPTFVKMIDDESGNRLVYDTNEVDSLIETFDTDEMLYNNLVSCLAVGHFNKIYNSIEIHDSPAPNGKTIKKFSNFTGLEYKTTKDNIDKYLLLKDARASRPWHYWFTSPIRNFYEWKAVHNIKCGIKSVAKSNGYIREFKSLARANNNRDKKLDELLLKVRKINNLIDIKETDNTIDKTRIEIEDVSDSFDVDHSIKVEGYGMTESVKYVKEDSMVNIKE